jgi:5-oxoprolinase (ATP-hydrolysing)
MIHKYSSLLSAYGISLAKLVSEASEPSTLTFSMDVLPQIQQRISSLKERVKTELLSQDVTGSSVVFETYLDLRYKGTDTNLSIEQPEDGDYKTAFIKTHLREFAFSLARDVVVDSIRVRGIGEAGVESSLTSPFAELEVAKTRHLTSPHSSTQKVYIKDGWKEFPVYQLPKIMAGSQIRGPALIIDNTQTIVIEPEFSAFVTSNHIIIEKAPDVASQFQVISAEQVSPVQLSVFAHRFMNIAEQMGNTLQRTSISTSIKERLDFSCAIFSPDGALVANAPHIPVHLGSMQFAIQYQHKLWLGKLNPGDVLLTNHPEAGGTHLPDLTVITPVFLNNEIIFYVASRGHHTDIGGIGITSMIPDSKELWEEGVSIKSLMIVRSGEFMEQEIRDVFAAVAEMPGCSATRRINDNISDLKAQISANQRGINLLQQLTTEYSLHVVHMYMGAIQANAEVAIKHFLRTTYKKLNGEPLKAVDYYDDGTPVVLKITIDGDAGTALFDFAGTGANTWGNMNSPISITHSAVIYALRCLIKLEIPLNQGCLNPVTISIPKGSILNPNATVAICGSTIASQRITDVIFRAFGACAASQGCANSFGWGMGGRDPRTGIVAPGWNYGESLGGGSGAGPGWHGAHGVNVHSTNTRNTDPEVIEKRTPVILRKYEIRRGSGGKGQWNGGDGVIREVEARVELKFSILSERRVYNPYGMQGGEPGGLGRNYVLKFRKNETGQEENKDLDLEKISLGGKAVVVVKAGERVQINTPGGGGWGVPQEKGNNDVLDVGERTRPEPFLG